MEFGEGLKELRKQNGYGINQLAIQSGVSASQISRIENGKRKPKIETIRKLAKGLRVPEGQLFDMAGIDASKEKQVIDIGKAIDNDEYMTNHGKQLTDKEKAMLKALFGE